MQYTINLNVEGLEMVDIESPSLKTLENDTVALYLGEESNTRLYDYYANIRTLLVNGNRIITLVSEESKIKKQICMLLITYDNYDIYTIEDINKVNFQYIMDLIDRQPTAEEVEMFVGTDISAYGELNIILAQMADLAKTNDIQGLTELVCNQVMNLENAVDVVDYIKRIADTSQTNFSTVVGQLKDNVEKLSNELSTTKSDLSSKELTLSRYKNDVDGFKDENNKLRKKYQELEERMGKSGQVIKSYTTLNTAAVKCKAQSILYLKEVSRPIYINSFIMQLYEVLTRMHKLRVKLLIYDNNVKYNIYKPLSIVDSNFYMSNKESVIEKNPQMVVTEPNANLLESVIKAQYDIVIIYDRLGQKEDLISGNQVYKFYTAASKNDAEACKRSDPKVINNRIIGHEGMMQDCIGIKRLEDYDDKASSSRKLSMYLNMENTCTGLNVKIIEYIMNIANITAIIKNKSING